jgi:hypothetical protein
MFLLILLFDSLVPYCLKYSLHLVCQFNDQYQCEVVSKGTYGQKFQEVQSKVKAAADAHGAELAEKESETPQI